MLAKEEEGEGRNHGRIMQVRLKKTTFLHISESGFETPFISLLLNASQILFHFSDKELKSFDVEKIYDHPMERPDQGHLHPKLVAPRLTCVG
jgi:hypothetical protein